MVIAGVSCPSFMMLTFDLFLQSYPGADNSTTLTTTQGYRSVSNIKLIYIIVFVSLSSHGMVSGMLFLSPQYNFRVWAAEMQTKSMIPLNLS